MIRALFLVLALTPSATLAQTVYKCKGADGVTVYSQQPCSKDAQPQEVKGQGVPSDLGDTSATETMQRNVATRNAELAERNCIAAAENRAWRPANDRIAAHNRRINALNYDIRRAANNLAGATWEAGMRQEIAGLQQTISTERATAQALATSGRQSCLDERQRRDAEIEAQSSPPTDP